jgi:hypothetical protein
MLGALAYQSNRVRCILRLPWIGERPAASVSGDNPHDAGLDVEAWGVRCSG